MTGKLKGMLPYAALILGAAFLYRQTGALAGLGRPGQLGPGFWPKAILVLLMAVCAIEMARMALSALLAPPALPREPGAPKAVAPAEEEKRHPWLLAAGIGLTILYVPGMEALGFFLATAIYLALFMYVGRYRRHGVIAATSVLGSLAFVFVFMKVVYVSLPLGMGPFRLFSAWLMAALGIR